MKGFIMNYITEIPVESAAVKILDEIAFYAKHSMKRNPVQISELISAYCDSDKDREDKIAGIVWPDLMRVLVKC